MGYPSSFFLFCRVCAAPSTGSSLSNRYWAWQTNRFGQSTQASSVAGLLLRMKTNTICGFPYLELLLNGLLGSFQYTVSIDTPPARFFSTLLMTILATSSWKQLVLFQTRPIQKRIRAISAGISLEVWSLDLAEFKWLRIAVIAFLNLAWGTPFALQCSTSQCWSEYCFCFWLFSESPKTTEFQLWHYCTGWQTPAHRFSRGVPQSMCVLLSVSCLFAKSCLIIVPHLKMHSMPF